MMTEFAGAYPDPAGADHAPGGSGGVTALVIMGASGNLTRTKLAPALFSLHRKGRLPAGVRIVGVARDDLDERRLPPPGCGTASARRRTRRNGTGSPARFPM